jgi:hypothetical protein
MTVIEDRLRDALLGGASQVRESPDLFTRISLSIEDDRVRRRQRRRGAAVLGCLGGALAAVLFAVTDLKQGELLMDWWTLELLTTVFLIGLALWLGPFIKRFGRSYAADVFRANPGTGKSFIVLTDVAYYLIFLSFILFTITFDLPSDWDGVVNGAQLKHEVSRVAGIVLIMGLLHGFNILALPVVGRLFTLNRRLDQDTPHQLPPDPGAPT